MNCNIAICAKHEVCKLLGEAKYDAVISIDHICKNRKWEEMKMQKRKKQIAKYCDNVLHLRFDDTNDPHDFGGPRSHHISKIVEFAAMLRDKKVLIHCVVGISRSTAAAIIVLQCLGHTYLESRVHVHQIRPIADPNTLMLNLYNQIVDDLDTDVA